MAKNKTTVPTYTYVVYTDSICTIRDTASGRLLQTAEAGVPNYFTAYGDSVTLSDDEATMVKPVFKCAPAALGLLDRGHTLPAGFTRVDFLQSTGTQHCRLKSLTVTDQDSVSLEFEVVSYIDRAANGLFSAFKYSSGDTLRAFASGNTTAATIGTAWGEARGTGLPVAFGQRATLGMTSAGTVYNGTPYGTSNSTEFSYSDIVIFAQYVNNQFWDSALKIYRFAVAGKCMLVPAVDASGAPVMFDVLTRQAYKNTGTGAFVVGVADLKQLRLLVKNLPANGGSLQLSLPPDGGSPEYTELLDSAAGRGWTLPVFEMRPAAVATYSLRRVRQVLWCRAIPDTHGNYVNASGKRVRLESCVAIYGPLGSDPVAYGYDPYDSLEHATESLGLSHYVPENNNENE